MKTNQKRKKRKNSKTSEKPRRPTFSQKELKTGNAWRKWREILYTVTWKPRSFSECHWSPQIRVKTIWEWTEEENLKGLEGKEAEEEGKNSKREVVFCFFFRIQGCVKKKKRVVSLPFYNNTRKVTLTIRLMPFHNQRSWTCTRIND